jgi:putative transposase
LLHNTELFNTDQGVQFTSAAFLDELSSQGVRISMDGKGRFLDNIFIERLWRSLKYEEVYIKAYGSVADARQGIGAWFGFYNRASEHPSVYVIEEKRFCWSSCDPVG